MLHLKMYLWAMMHSDQFRICMIRLPIGFRVRKSHEWGVKGFVFTMELVMPALYIPWEVKEQYWAAQGHELLFDDFPF